MALSEWTRIFQTKTRILQRGDSWRLEFDDRLVPDSPNPGWEQYIGSSSAWYKCTLCGRGWPSIRVMVVFHMHLRRGKGVVKVKPLGQSCTKCNAAPMEMPRITPENITVLMRNLVEMIRIKCYHKDLEIRSRPFKTQNIQIQSPHEPAHCAACLYGICKSS